MSALKYFFIFLGILLIAFLKAAPIAYGVTCPDPVNPCWAEKAPMPTIRGDFGISSDSSGKVYIVGGYNNGFLDNVEYYDSTLDTWTTKNKMPFATADMGFSYSITNNKFYLGGGYNGTYINNFYQYDPDMDTWTEKAPMPTARSLFGLISLTNGHTYAIGGQTYPGIAINNVEEYDPTSNTWTEKAPMPTARIAMGIATFDGKIYVIGGHLDSSGSNSNLSTVEEYDPDMDTWTEKAAMPTARSLFGIALNEKGYIDTVGGTTDLNSTPITDSNDVEEYNPILDIWTTFSKIPVYSHGIGLALGASGKLYAIGGTQPFGNILDSNYEGVFPNSTTPTSSPSPTPIHTSIQLNVPLLKQTNPLWANQIYDNANIWSPQFKTISDWGCALTSYSMILNYYGYNKLPSGQILTPGTLNNWLKNEKNGYINGIDSGYVNPEKIAQLSSLAKSINHITRFDELEFNYSSSNNIDLVRQDLLQGIPDVIGEPGHFVIATGINDNIISINDPYYNRSTLNDGYDNSIESINRLVPSNSDLSYIIIFSTNTNINVQIKDSNGNSVGQLSNQEPLINPRTAKPGGKSAKIIYFQKPNTGNYTIAVSSSKPQIFDLKLLTYDTKGNENSSNLEGLSSNNNSYLYALQFDKNFSSKNHVRKIANKSLLNNFLSLLYYLKSFNENLFK